MPGQAHAPEKPCAELAPLCGLLSMRLVSRSSQQDMSGRLAHPSGLASQGIAQPDIDVLD